MCGSGVALSTAILVPHLAASIYHLRFHSALDTLPFPRHLTLPIGKMVYGMCVCGWAPGPNVQSTGRALLGHARYCAVHIKRSEERRNAKRTRSEDDLQDEDRGALDHPQKTPRLSQVGILYISGPGSEMTKQLN